MDRLARRLGSPTSLGSSVAVLRAVATVPALLRSAPVASAALGGLLYAWLLWPALTGLRVLAPTDILTAAGLIGQAAGTAQNDLLFDPVLVFLPWMHYAAECLRSGQWPWWNPFIFAGAPFVAANQSALYSPFRWLFFLWPSPATLAWIQVVKAAVAAAGACLALQRLRVRPFIAVPLAAAYPLSGFMFAWMQYPLSDTAVWLPWLFWAVQGVLNNPGLRPTALLAAATGLVCLAGHLETAAQILLGVGTYAAVLLLRNGFRFGLVVAVRCAAALATGFLVGLLAAAPQLLPTADYLTRSHRVTMRVLDAIETHLDEPYRWAEFIRLLQPYAFGSRQPGSRELSKICLNEGGANGYVGATAAVILLPLAVAYGWKRVWPMILVAVLAAAPMLQIPVLRHLQELPPLHTMNNSRLLLITGWLVLTASAVGLQAWVLAKRASLRTWVPAAVGLAAGVCLLSLLMAPPPRVVHLFTAEAWPWFREKFLGTAWGLIAGGAILAGAASLTPAGLSAFARGAAAAVAAIVLLEVATQAKGYNPLVPRETYYPQTPLTKALTAKAGVEDRFLGLAGAVTPNLGMMYGLRDVRGYDAVDPLPYVELLQAANPKAAPRSYAVTLRYWSGPHPVLDMLAVRWIVSPVRLTVDSWYEVGKFDGLWLYENVSALPRAYVPRTVVVEPAVERCLDQLSRTDFDPRRVALVNEPVEGVIAGATGRVEVVAEKPNRVKLRATLDRPGLVVLSDSWDPWWTVRVDGTKAKAVRVNHALRGVVVPEGNHVIEWIYRPWPGYVGLGLGLLAWGVIAATGFIGARRRSGARRWPA